jgi:hypothetical protein
LGVARYFAIQYSQQTIGVGTFFQLEAHVGEHGGSLQKHLLRIWNLELVKP